MPMKTTLYPVRDGCLTPVEVFERIRIALRRSTWTVAVASRDPAFAKLKGVVLSKRVGESLDELLALKPDMVVIDSLDLTRQDGQDGTVHPESTRDPTLPLAAGRLRETLDRLRDGLHTREVLLVAEGDGISPSWRERLDAWGVDIRWELANSEPWRTWSFETHPRQSGERGAERLKENGNGAGIEAQVLMAEVHSARSRNLLAVVAEYSDLRCRGKDRRIPSLNPHDDAFFPSRLLNRLLDDGSLDDRLNRTTQLIDDLTDLTMALQKRETALEESVEQTWRSTSETAQPHVPDVWKGKSLD